MLIVFETPANYYPKCVTYVTDGGKKKWLENCCDLHDSGSDLTG